MDVWFYVWLAVTVLALIVEFITNEMICIWFAGGGLISLVLSAVGLSWYIHLPVFVVISFALLFCFRRLVLKKFNNGESMVNADAAIGKEFVLLSPIGFNQLGTIKINGVVWNVDTQNQQGQIPEGTTVIVKEIRGNKYIVEPVSNEQDN